MKGRQPLRVEVKAGSLRLEAGSLENKAHANPAAPTTGDTGNHRAQTDPAASALGSSLPSVVDQGRVKQTLLSVGEGTDRSVCVTGRIRDEANPAARSPRVPAPWLGSAGGRSADNAEPMRDPLLDDYSRLGRRCGGLDRNPQALGFCQMEAAVRRKK